MQPSEFTRLKIKELWDAYKANGGTQKSLAAASGATQGNISLWTRGRLPTVDGLLALSRGFKVPVLAFYPPEDSLLGSAVAILAGLNESELRTVMPFIENAAAMASQGVRPGQRKKLADDNG